MDVDKINACKHYIQMVLIKKNFSLVYDFVPDKSLNISLFDFSKGPQQIESDLKLYHSMFDVKNILFVEAHEGSGIVSLIVEQACRHIGNFLGIEATDKMIKVKSKFTFFYVNEQMQQYSILTTNMDEILKELTGAREAAKILKKISDSKTAKELFFLEKIRAEFKKEQCHLSYQETRALILTTENVSSINIAKILNCSHSTARTHIRNAQAKYRNSLPYNNLVAWIDKNELTEYIKYYCAYLCR